jgi:hypothetical protein
MIYSEKTQREINKYFKRLVRRMPTWLRLLFDEERIAFTIDPSGAFALEVDSALDNRTKGNAQTLIYRYLNKHKPDFIKCESIN